MVKDILIETESGQTRLALLEDGELAEYYVERNGQESLTGNIYLGRVANILPGMQSAFIDIGREKNAFLHAGDIYVPTSDVECNGESICSKPSNQSIKEILKNGQELLVQVVKEPGGTKGPRVSSHITLPGRMVVLLPTYSSVSISRRIEEEPERMRLRQIAEGLCPKGMGMIVRTAAEGAEEADFKQDLEHLLRLWTYIQQRATHSVAPALIHRDESLVYRSVRDMLDDDVRTLFVDNIDTYKSVRETACMLTPDLAERVTLYTKKTPLFDLYRVDSRVSKALSRHVWLKSGGYLVIDYTEALTVIDVNTGKFVGSHSLAETILKLNCEASIEIVRQLRLRDIGGIVIIDFIDMEAEEDREQLLSTLRQELKKDHAKTNLVGLTNLGLVEMTRKKKHQSIHTQINCLCPICQGTGMLPSDETMARVALHELRAQVANVQAACWLITAASGVAGQLMLIGTSSDICAYVHVDASLPMGKYFIAPATQKALPPKSRALPRYA